MNILKRKNKKSSLWFYLRYLAVFALAPILNIALSELDLARNPWLEDAASGFNWSWHSFLTLDHTSTLLYVQRSPWFIAESLVIAIVMIGMLWWYDIKKA